VVPKKKIEEEFFFALNRAEFETFYLHSSTCLSKYYTYIKYEKSRYSFSKIHQPLNNWVKLGQRSNLIKEVWETFSFEIGQYKQGKKGQ
jgi:hypothetical protein